MSASGATIRSSTKTNECERNARIRTGGDALLCEASEKVGGEAGVAEAREERHR